MKKFFTLAFAVLAAAGASAYVVNQPADLALRNAVPLKADGITRASDEIITEQPEGEFTLMTKDCQSFKVNGLNTVTTQIYGSALSTVINGDTFYFTNPVAEFPADFWVKATISGNKISYKGAQPIAKAKVSDGGSPITIYLVPMMYYVYDQSTQAGTYVVYPGMSYDMEKGDDGVYRATDKTALLGVCYMFDEEEDPAWVWTGYGNRDITFREFNAESVKLPDTATPSEWIWNSDGTANKVSVAIDGTDFYVTGMDPTVKDGWVKGSIAGDKVTFPSGQYIGINQDYINFSYFFGASVTEQTNEDGITTLSGELRDNVTFNYDADAQKIWTDGTAGYILNGSSSSSREYQIAVFKDVTVACQHRNPDALPAAPYNLVWSEDEYGKSLDLEIPNYDVDGNFLDNSKLYYEFFVDGKLYTFSPEDYTDFTELTTRIPYTFTGYDFYMFGLSHTVYFYFNSVNKLGVRTAYLNENGEWIYSATSVLGEQSVEGIDIDREIKAQEYFDATGCRVTSNAPGIQIVRTIYTDGTVSVAKRIVR